MAQPYLDDLTRMVEARVDQPGVVCKHFFSGAAAYIGDDVFMTLTPVGLAFKLREPTRTRLFAQDGIPLQYFPKAPIKREYVCFADPAELSARRLRSLMTESLAYASTH